MAKTKKVGKAGRFGVRYGLKIRKRFLSVEAKKTKICPYCFKRQLKRVASGIFECKACGRKFAGKAYYP